MNPDKDQWNDWDEEFDWDDIIKAIINEKCVLFLGPHAYLDDAGNILEEDMLHASTESGLRNRYIHAYYEDGFYLFRQKKHKRKYIDKMQEYYNSVFPKYSSSLKKLAQIPFNFVVTFTPDALLPRAFKELNLNCQHSYYHKNHPPLPFLLPSKEMPLIYNMLGHFDQHDSLVLTHNDLFDYLKSVFEGNSMGDPLRSKLSEAHQYIFLGLPFEKWYMQLLLRLLSLHTHELEHLDRLATKPIAEVKKNLFIDQFKIEFMPDDTSTFIDQLYTKFKEKGDLRVPTSGPAESKSLSEGALIKLITKGEEEEVFRLLEFFFQNSFPRNEEMYDEFIILKRTYDELISEELAGAERPYFGQEKNRAIRSLVKVIRRLKLNK